MDKAWMLVLFKLVLQTADQADLLIKAMSTDQFPLAQNFEHATTGQDLEQALRKTIIDVIEKETAGEIPLPVTPPA